MLALNLDSMFFMTQAVAAELKAHSRPGSLVSIASASGLNAAPFHVGYGTAKAAIRSIVQTMALELASAEIRVNTVAPGTTATPVAIAEDDLLRDRAAIPMGRRGKPDEVAGTVLYLLSDLATYVTGQCIAVDGGATLRWSLIGEDNIPRYVSASLRESFRE
jgi:NAD(P)-dependent dehydrogenase (short-subunit alcohol dehydrogenase family)